MEDALPLPPPPPPVGGTEIAPGIRVADDAIELHYARSSGPGGQNVNKVNTKADLRLALTALAHLPPDVLARLRASAGRFLTAGGYLHFQSDTHRTQEQNRAAVLEQLRSLLIAAQRRPKLRKKTRPSKAAKRRRVESKKRRSEVKRNRRSPD